MVSHFEKLQEAAQFLRTRIPQMPSVAMVLGSGFADALTHFRVTATIPYRDIPHFKEPSVQGHAGRLMVGEIDSVSVVVLKGRVHFYEGHSMNDVVFSVRALALAGADVFILTNASGGLNPEFRPLDFMLMRDHINFMGTNPLVGPNIDELGPRFPDLTDVYDKNLRKIFLEIAAVEKLPLHEGVYVAFSGPVYETPAEIKLFRQGGADVCGMSTVPEAIALRHMGKRIVGLSCVTNVAGGMEPVTHEEVLQNAAKMYKSFSTLVESFLRKIGKQL